MPTPAIVTERLSKRYVLGERERFPTMRDALARAATAPLRRRAAGTRQADELWALRDLSLVIDEGDVVGFIGRNGAGKSTLLKVVSRITAPTSGYAEIHGRVGALLEVGTGFHPELTGRENVFLNGAILGMTRAETRRKLDEIVDFAGVEPFLDTPVKRFSSGMQVRLAFAVAAHLDPEILIVDEVLAVGDVEFQRKCLGKMGEFARDGRTVLFVSHNLAIVQALCQRAIFLQRGELVDDGNVRDVVATYLRSLEDAVAVELRDRTDRHANTWGDVVLDRIRISGGDGEALATGRPARFDFDLEQRLPTARISCRFVVHDSLGLAVATFDTDVRAPDDSVPAAFEGDAITFTCEIDELPLTPGRYRIDVVVRGEGHLQDGIDAAAFFNVESGTIADRPVRAADTVGPAAVAHCWTARPTGC